MNIVELIPYGKENAISRSDLCNKTGLSDRLVRRQIAKKRRDYVILNLQDGKGYYRPTDKADIEIYIRQETARAKSIFWTLRAARNELRRGLNGQ